MSKDPTEDEEPAVSEVEHAEDQRPKREWVAIGVQYLKEQKRRITRAARNEGKLVGPFIREAVMKEVAVIEASTRARREEKDEARRRRERPVPAWADFAITREDESPPIRSTSISAQPPSNEGHVEWLVAWILEAEGDERDRRHRIASEIVAQSPSDTARFKNLLTGKVRERGSWWQSLIPKP